MKNKLEKGETGTNLSRHQREEHKNKNKVVEYWIRQNQESS